MVIRRSFQFSIFLVAITAGIAQAVPEINGTKLFPLNPNRRIIRSIKKTTRLIYPLSSKMEMNRNKKAICGIKITMPPIPDTIPSANKSVTFPPFGKVFLIHSASPAKVVSIKSMGMVAQS